MRDFGSGNLWKSSAHLPQVVIIPCRRNTFPRRVRTRLIRARGNTLLAQFAHMPVLPVYHVPKLNGIIRIKIAALERLRMEKPIAKKQCPFRRLLLCDWFFHTEVFKRSDFDSDDAIKFWDMVNRQDWHVW